MKLRMLGLVVGLAVIVGSVVGGVAFADRGGGSPSPAVVVDSPSASAGQDDSGHHAGDTPHATPSRTGEDADDDRGGHDADDATCQDNAPTQTAGADDCRRGADHPED